MIAIEQARESLRASFPGIEPFMDTKATTNLGRARHCLWMLVEVEKFLAADEREKAMRWIGFVQGALWLMDLRSIDAMRDDVRKDVQPV